MGQTRMFRDRVVSMEQTLEGGEKHLPLLKELCREAFPDLEFREHALDHERDLFVMDFADAGGARTRVCWTRMVLYDAERIPTLTGDPAGALRSKIVEFLRARSGKSEILVTFRHLEDGWTDTPEPRREGRRRRRGGRAGRGQERGAPERRPAATVDRRPGGSPGGGPAQSGPARKSPAQRVPSQRGPAPPRPAMGEARAGGPAEPSSPSPGGKRRRRRRRRGGRGPGGGSPGPSGPAPSVPRP